MSGPATACPGCGATYAAAPPVCLICGRAFAPQAGEFGGQGPTAVHAPATAVHGPATAVHGPATAVHAPAPVQAAPATAQASPQPRRRRRPPKLIRLVSLVSMLAGLGSTALGVTRVLQSGTHAHPTQVAAQAAPSAASSSAKGAAAAPASASPNATPHAETSSTATAVAPSSAKPVAPPPSLSVTAHAATPGPSTCSNDVFGYSLRYQGAWTTSNVTSEQACAFFDTSPIDQSELLQASRAGRPARAAIQITPYGGASSYDQAVIDIHNRRDMDAGDTIDLGVGNTFGERIMAKVTTSSGAHTRMFMYLFSLRGKPFVAGAYEPYSANFDQTVRDLDRMMRTLHVA